MSSGRHVRRRFSRRASVLLLVLATALVAAGGSALAAYRYDRSSATRILPGVSVAGVDVGGMTRKEAIRVLRTRTVDDAGPRLLVRVGDRTWRATYRQLGARPEVSAAVDRALDLSRSFSLASRLYHRILGRPVHRSFGLSYQVKERRLAAFLHRIDREISRAPRNAAVALVDGRVVRQHSRPGVALSMGASERRLRHAVEVRSGAVTLPLRKVSPAVADDDLGQTIVVRLSENRLYLYRGFEVVRTYRVATGMPGFTTPVGTWEVVDKAENPTWVNPAPDGWGAGLPEVIPPGPGNPLGTRALYLNAPGIRIHGTYDAGSIGTYASHGCIRMTIEDSEELYPLVDVGTPVLVLD